ncbi:MAG: riboflavin biosynthesis protein RibF [Clostridia bacterium]|nr:riboflavin biosynthesis protein RibF [Clostridia bacterium]
MEANTPRRVVALGFFDGLHLGHKAVIDRAIALAHTMNATPCILTFDRRPKNLARGESAELLCDFSGREALVRKLFGNVELIALTFDEALRQMPWQTFAADVLLKKLGAVAAVCGENFRFGALGVGTPTLLQTMLPTEVVGELSADGQTVSSTVIRALLADGKVGAANRLLGHPHFLCGPVIHGDGRGATLGFATLNIAMPTDLVKPRAGVYATVVTLGGETYHAITNFGTRPTFYENGIYNCETHVFGLSRDCYGETAELSLIGFVRPEQKFDTREALIAQIREDVAIAEQILQHYDETGEYL